MELRVKGKWLGIIDSGMDLRVRVYGYRLRVSGMDLKVWGLVLWIIGLGFGFKSLKRLWV